MLNSSHMEKVYCVEWLVIENNLVPRAFSSFKMVDRRNPWPRLLKYSKNHRVFCHMAHDEMAFSEVVSSVWRPCLFSAIGNCCSNETKTFHRVYMTNFCSHFGSLGQGFLRSAILNEEKALGMRLYWKLKAAEYPTTPIWRVRTLCKTGWKTIGTIVIQQDAKWTVGYSAI